jgi:hypothetical protein
MLASAMVIETPSASTRMLTTPLLRKSFLRGLGGANSVFQSLLTGRFT